MNAQPLKLVFAGPVGAGKTTAIAAIADAPPVSTDTPMSEGSMGDKTTTTVAFDFATLKTEEGDLVFLYGLPGQERFDFMRRIILTGRSEWCWPSTAQTPTSPFNAPSGCRPSRPSPPE